jgi:SAM-dependent methyltransferase
MVPSRDHVWLGPHQTRPHPLGDDRLLAKHARRRVTLDPILGAYQGNGIGSKPRFSCARRREPTVSQMSEDDRRRWDDRYTRASQPAGAPGPPEVFASLEHLFPTACTALEIACGRGEVSVWLASRGMEVFAVDISPVAIDLARDLAFRSAVSDRCRFEVWDLDDGLPPGRPVDLVVCHMYREPRLDRELIDRLAPGGLLVITSLSEVGAGPGRFRARPGELREAFDELEILTEDEGDGVAWMLGRRSG